MSLDYLKREDVLEERENFIKMIETRKIISKLLDYLVEFGDKKIDKRIEKVVENYFKENGISFIKVRFYNNDWVRDYIDRFLEIEIYPFKTENIETLNGYKEDIEEYGYYKNLKSGNNQKFLLENIEKLENERLKRFDYTLEVLDTFNEKLREVNEMNDIMRGWN